MPPIMPLNYLLAIPFNFSVVGSICDGSASEWTVSAEAKSARKKKSLPRPGAPPAAFCSVAVGGVLELNVLACETDSRIGTKD